MNSTALTVIRWRLNEVMARYHIRNVQLAEKIDISQNAISNLRGSKTMPRIDGDRLNSLCVGLTRICLEQGEKVTITPTDLIEFTMEGEVA